jgi:hypothetical protein
MPVSVLWVLCLGTDVVGTEAEQLCASQLMTSALKYVQKPPTACLQMLRVFFPETTEMERRQLSITVPPSVSPCSGLYDCLELETLLEKVHAKYLPPRTDAYTKKMWESVRQLLGALGLGDHMDEEGRNQLFDQIDVDGNQKVCCQNSRSPKVERHVPMKAST